MLKLKKERVLWVDTIKAVGMLLVFYGHIAERVASSGGSLAFYQFKFTHSFLMPMFFILAGFFMKPPKSFSENLKKLILRRLLPVFAFAIFFMPLWMLFYYFTEGYVDWYQLVVKTLYYLKGSPQLNLITWFLVCLFTCEVLASLITPSIRSRAKLLPLGIIILFSGLLICKYIAPIAKLTGISANTWYFHEGIVAMGFYFIGYSVFPFIKRLAVNYKWSIYLLLPVFLTITLLTFNLNSPYKDFTVLLVISEHGDIIPFVVTAFSGAFFLISLCILIPFNRFFAYIGRNTLYLIGLNGIFHHFLNGFLIDFYAPQNNMLAITLYCTVIVLLSLALCYPVIHVMDKYLPQLFGKTSLYGPFLPNLEQIHWRKMLVGKIDAFGTKRSILRKEKF